MPGHEYIFRIRAQNKYGVGDPLDSEPEVARDVFSKYSFTYLKFIYLETCCVFRLHLFHFITLMLFYVYFLVPPGQCDKPTLSSVTIDSMTVNWEEPDSDGGTPITGYWLERKETTSKRWNRVTRDPVRPMPLGISHRVTGLIEGSQYLFHVIAINASGCGPPSEPSDPTFARDPIGRKKISVRFNFISFFINRDSNYDKSVFL